MCTNTHSSPVASPNNPTAADDPLPDALLPDTSELLAVPPNSDLPSHTQTLIDDEFDRVFGDHIHLNDGTHLHNNISDDTIWQHYYQRLTNFHCSPYEVPTGSLGQRFISTLASLLNGVNNFTHNSEKFEVFIITMLQRDPIIRRTRDIKHCLEKRLNAWDLQQFNMLVNETERHMQFFLSHRRHTTTPLQRRKHFNKLVQQGNLTKAVNYITSVEQTSLLYPSDDVDGNIVHDILASKHPSPTTTAYKTLHEYGDLPDLVPLTITDDIVLKIARRLQGSGGLDGVDAHALRRWLTRFDEASLQLRTALATLTENISNKLYPWASIRALMSCRLVSLDKNPGVRPIGIGQIWRRAMAKCFLAVTAPAATEACAADQLCAGLSAGIEGAIHAATTFWTEHTGDSDFGFLCIDATNAFNEMNRVTMLWTIRHEWPQGALFVFNCYKHWARLVAHDPSGDQYILFSKVGVTQGDPVSMIAYGLGLLPLIRLLKLEFPDIKFHSWYADDSAVAGSLSAISKLFKRLQKLGPHYGYFPNASKSWLIVPSRNLATAEQFVQQPNNPTFQVTIGRRYLGGFVGESAKAIDWLYDKTSKWETSINRLTATCQDYPQSAYCAMQKSLQMQWQFLQRVFQCDPDAFANIESAIANKFLPALFGSTPPSRMVTTLPVKLAGLALPDPTATCLDNFQTSQAISGEIVQHLITRSSNPPEFCLKDHLESVYAVRAEFATRLFAARKARLDTLMQHPQPQNVPRPALLERAKSTGVWLSVVPTTILHTQLSSLEFRDALHLRYDLPLKDLPTSCDSCHAPFTVAHALTCKKGGLITLRHNELRNELASIATAAFTPSAIRLEPSIYLSSPTTSSSSNAQPQQPPASPSNSMSTSSTDHHTPPTPAHHERGDILVRGFFSPAKDCIIDVTVTHLDAESYKSKEAKAVLRSREKAKKNKYARPCAAQRRDFVPFAVSADGLFGQEAKSFVQRLASSLAVKWDRPYPPVCGYINARLAISLVRASHLCIRGSRCSTTSIGFHAPPLLQVDHENGFHLLQQ